MKSDVLRTSVLVGTLRDDKCWCNNLRRVENTSSAAHFLIIKNTVKSVEVSFNSHTKHADLKSPTINSFSRFVSDHSKGQMWVKDGKTGCKVTVRFYQTNLKADRTEAAFIPAHLKPCSMSI